MMEMDELLDAEVRASIAEAKCLSMEQDNVEMQTETQKKTAWFNAEIESLMLRLQELHISGASSAAQLVAADQRDSRNREEIERLANQYQQLVTHMQEMTRQGEVPPLEFRIQRIRRLRFVTPFWVGGVPKKRIMRQSN